MLSVSVSNLELYRMWKEDDDLDLGWLLNRLRGLEPQSPQMAAGEALHKALEVDISGETPQLVSGDYTFWFQAQCEIELPTCKELPIEKQYGDLLVRGRIDGLMGNTVIDYKSTGQFDADRLMDGFQWRLYLDMTGCDTFIWKVFVLKEDAPFQYVITQFHELRQHRYEGMHEECERLAYEFCRFAEHLDGVKTEWRRESKEPGATAPVYPVAGDTPKQEPNSGNGPPRAEIPTEMPGSKYSLFK